ncbi:MAG TPA: hypothetical protein VGF32_29955 [Streptosporangiaceae bacterium]|jgi:hypothetical protein
MTSDHRIKFKVIADVLDALDRHGYVRGDDQHADHAMSLIGDLARIWDGTQDYPAGAHLTRTPSSQPVDPGPGGPTTPDEVVLADGDVSTVVIALDIAADYARDRAELCADCADQSCPTCEARLRDAQAYDRIAAQIDQAADARAAQCDQPEPGSRTCFPRQADPAAGLEAGQ